jgi:hypothetical protein
MKNINTISTTPPKGISKKEANANLIKLHKKLFLQQIFSMLSKVFEQPKCVDHITY